MPGPDDLKRSAIEKIAKGNWEVLQPKEQEVIAKEGYGELLGYAGPDKVISNVDYWLEHKETPESQTYQSKIPSLDVYTKGFQKGEVWVISGPSKHGKTTLCESIGHEITNQGAKCLWFSYEMPHQFMTRQKDTGDIIYLPREKRSGDLGWIEKRVLEAKLKYDVDAVFLDHLHYLAPFEKLLKNPSITIGQLMRTLKSEIAVKYNLLIFLVAHVAKLDFKEEPNENDIRDSSFVTQEADGTIMVYRRLKEGKGWMDQDPFDVKAKLIVCNTRRSGAMRAKVSLVKIGNYLVEEEYERSNTSWND